MAEAAPVGVLDALGFLAELALLVGLAVAGARTGSGPSAVVLAVVLPVGLAVLWGGYLAPRAGRRLRYPSRLAAKLAAVLLAAGALLLTGALTWGLALLVLAGLPIAAAEIRAAGENNRT